MDSSSTLLMPGQTIRPVVKSALPVRLIERLYGMRVKSVTELNGYDDRNYHVICEKPSVTDTDASGDFAAEGYVMKIMNSLDSQRTDVIEAQTEILLFLNGKGITCPLPVKNLAGAYYSLDSLNADDEADEEDGAKHVVRLLVYRPGELLTKVTLTKELLWKVGRYAANLDSVLRDFSHPAYEKHETVWMLGAVPKLRQFVYAIENPEHERLVLEVVEAFEKRVLGNAEGLERGLIHGDLNEQNIVMSADGSEIVAVIDWSDVSKTHLIFELAIALCYMILQAADVGMGRHVIEGYQTIRKLGEQEKAVLKICVCARLCQSLTLGAYTHLNDPQNDYLLITQKPGWALLTKIWPMSDDEISNAWALRADS